MSQSYGISVDEDTLDRLEQIYALNITTAEDLTVRSVRLDEARRLLISIVEDPVDESMSGTLWLFPCAVGFCSHGFHPRIARLISSYQGGVLILVALRSLAWSKPKHAAGYVVHGLQVTFGLGLALLGVLDIGSRRITVDGEGGANHNLNPLYVLLQQRLPLFVVLGVYGLTVSTEAAVLRLITCRRRAVLADVM